MVMLPAQAPAEQGSIDQIRPTLAGSRRRSLAGRSDESLVAIAKEGDERAFEILYERHEPAILRYCRSLLRSTQEAEDVKQEVFVLAISALRRGAQPDAFRPWLYRVAYNACMSHLRVRRPVLVADNGVLVGPAGTAEPFDGHREELRQLLDDIGKLPDVQRGALLLREMDGFSYEQVGEVLGLPLSTVRASIFRARRTLQGLAEARDADCEQIQSELSRLADRRGRRGRHITTHLHVCPTCREFRDGLRRRPALLSGVQPAAPFGSGGLLLAIKGKLFGGTAAGGAGAVLATGGGGAGVAKIAAVAASSIALLASAGVEADRVIEHSHREAATSRRDAAAAPSARATGARTTVGAAAAAAAGASAVDARVDAPLRKGRIIAGHPGTVTRPPTGASRGSGGPPATGGHGAARPTSTAAGAPAPSGSSATTGERAGDSSARSGERDGTGARHHGSRGGDEGSSGPGGSSESGSSSRGATRGHPAQQSDDATTRPDAGDDAGVPSGAPDATPPSAPHSNSSGPPPQTATTPSPGSGTPPPNGGTTTPAPAPPPAPAPAPPVDPAPPETAPADSGTTGTTTTTAPPADPGAAVVPSP
jgi:RNA polymerase sigma factor (sigma-70 family)